MNNQNSQNHILYYPIQANGNVRQQPNQFNLTQNSGNLIPFTQISKEKDYTYANQPPVLNQQHIQLQPPQLMINQQKIPNQNIPNTLQSLATNFPNQIVKKQQQQFMDLNYAQPSRSSLTPVQQVQQATTVTPPNPFAGTSINNPTTQMTLNAAQTSTIPQNLQKNQQYLQNNLLNGNNNKQAVNQNHIVQNNNSNNLQTQDVLQPEMTLQLNTTQNQIKGTTQKKQQQIAFQATDQTKQNNQLQQKNSQYQQISLQQQQSLPQFIQIPSTLNQQQNQQQNLAQQQVSMHQNIHNPQPIIKSQNSTQPQQNINEFDSTHYIVPKAKSSIINNQNNANNLANNYIDFNQQQKQKDQQKIDQLSNLYPQQQLQNQQLLQQERIEDKKIQLIKDIQQIPQQNQLQQVNMIQNEGEGENAFGEAAQVERFINIQKNSKVLILSEKIRIKYENKDVNNSLCSDFDINSWTNEIDNIINLYEMTLTGHLIKAIEFMNGETSLSFLIEITKPFLKNQLRKKSGKPFGDGDENRIIKGGLAEYCFQKKDQNQDIWTLNQEKLPSIINDTNEKLKKYIDNLKKSKGKGQTSVISQGNDINQSFQQQDHQNLNDTFQGSTKATKNGDKKQRRKNQEKLKDKTAEKQNAIYNNLGKEHNDNYGENHLEEQNDLIMNEGYHEENDRNSDIMLGDEEEKKENHGNQSFINAQIQNYQKQNKINSIKQEETNLLNNQGFYLSSNPSLIQNQYSKNIDIKIESQQDRKVSQQIGIKQNSFSIPENNSKKRIFHSNDENFDEGIQNNGASSKTALYRQHQGTQQNNNLFNDQNELNQGFNSNQVANLNGNQNSFQNKGFVLSNKVEQQNEDIQHKIELTQRQINCKKLTEQQIKEYKKKYKIGQFLINEQLNQELEKKENQDITKSINQIDQLKIVGMALCYGVFKDQITKMVNVIKENQDAEVRKMNQRSKEMKQMLQQLQLL
ncbi:hypothetical protein TTHERM_00285530 (macronuclear) [Tetrahymena thermophila SB210]|uniref:Uncharacterized protein n=1 Tax=Tetrahymena thermophila (strain SB210) TaxID=312017 RepID=I7MKF3_TETTS|nr:hypothetical protein TTHERM_00285530 [Tetrahymena thermophila SB210]EAR98322.2 hypothetical protein TTHERM_00285530 [Tetrahymena thermophila SB210]|eukprot:XP_001018567.2 hypothetical protein TTHERM_00285530 [Tetrahymena thermophila SB210]